MTFTKSAAAKVAFMMRSDKKNVTNLSFYFILHIFELLEPVAAFLTINAQ